MAAPVWWFGARAPAPPPQRRPCSPPRAPPTIGWSGVPIAEIGARGVLAAASTERRCRSSRLPSSRRSGTVLARVAPVLLAADGGAASDGNSFLAGRAHCERTPDSCLNSRRSPSSARHAFSPPVVSRVSHTGAVEVIPAEAIAAIVAGLEPSSSVVGTSGLPGGLSSWMTRIEVQRSDGSRHGLVVRRGRRPDAERHTLSFGVEFELLGHLDAHGIPVARPRAFDDSGRILPHAYVVLDFVQGTTRFTTDDPVGMAVQMADVLAAIHDLDATSASLPVLPLHTDRMQGWVITDLTRRQPDPHYASTWFARGMAPGTTWPRGR